VEVHDPSIYSGVPEWVWEPFALDALKVLRANGGEEHNGIVHATSLLAMGAVSRSAFAEAESLASDTLDRYRRMLPGGHQGLIYSGSVRAEALLELGQAQEAERLLIPGYRYALSGYPLDHPYRTRVLRVIADLYARTGRPAMASEVLIPVLREAGAASRDPDVLARLARVVARQQGLQGDLYAEALEPCRGGIQVQARRCRSAHAAWGGAVPGGTGGGCRVEPGAGDPDRGPLCGAGRTLFSRWRSGGWGG
jgi:hypothetical protein